MLIPILTLLCATSATLGDPACPGLGRLGVTTADSNDFYGDGLAVTAGWAAALSTAVDFGSGPERGLLDLWRDGPGGWTLHDQLQPFELPDVDRLNGVVVAGGGDRIVFGGFDETGPGAGFGRVVVLQRSGSTWGVDAVLSSGVASAPGVPGDGFGSALALSGDRLAVGAMGASVDVEQQGLVHTFRRDPGGWVSTGVLAAPSPAAIDRFGYGLGLTDSWLAVIAPNVDQAGPDGAVYLFERVGETWTLRHETDPQVPAADGQFGFTVAFSPPTLAVGAPQTTGIGAGASGSVHLYRLVGQQLLDDQVIDGAAASHSGRTGESLGLSAGRLLVGSPVTSAGAVSEVYAYERVAAVWTLQQTLTACDTSTPGLFGEGLGLDGSRLIVGSPSLSRLQTFEHDGAGFAPAEELLMGAEVSASRGGLVRLLIEAEGSAPGSQYVLLGSLSGTSPGVTLQGFAIPLNFDVWFQLLLGFPSGGAFGDFQGSLDGSVTQATLSVPANLPVSLVGLRFDHAWVEVQGSQIQSVSEAEGFELIP